MLRELDFKNGKNMSDSDSKKCFISKDGILTEGPIIFSDLKQLHAKGELQNGMLCSVQDPWDAYDLWRPVSRHYLKRQDFDSRSRQGSGLADLFRIYLGWFIGLNLTDPKEFDVGQLVRVESDFFGVKLRGGEDIFHYPYTQVVSVAESMAQIECKIQKPIDRTIKQGALSKFFNGNVQDAPPDWVKVKIEVPLLVEVNHLIVYKGSVGVSVSMPMNQ